LIFKKPKLGLKTIENQLLEKAKIHFCTFSGQQCL
jgi:hypothetical protein